MSLSIARMNDGIPTHSGDDTVESGLEPGDGVLGSDLVLVADSGLLLLPLGDTHTGSAHDDVEVHSEDSNSGVVLDSEIDVLLDSESEVSGLTRIKQGWTRCQGREEDKGQCRFGVAPGRSSSTSS